MSPSNLPEWLDADHDGKPDPWVARTAWWLAKLIVRAFAPPHTMVRQGIEKIDAELP